MSDSNDFISLGELIRLTFPPGASVPPALERERPVRWVVVAGPGVTPGPGDLVLCAQRPTPAEQQVWVKQDVAGVACLEALDGAVRLPPGASLRAVQQAALRLLMDRHSYLAERGAHVHQQLVRQSLDGAGLTALARTMADLTGKSILIQDKRLEPLGLVVQPALSAAWPALADLLSQSHHLPESLRDRRQAAARGVSCDQPLPDGLLRRVAPIVAKELARGYLSVVGPAGAFDALDQLVVEYGAAACALEMAKAKAVSEAEKRAYGDFIDAVLTRSLPTEELALWAKRLNHDLRAPHAALVWRWGPAARAPSLRRLETLVNQAVARTGLSALVRLRGAEVAAFCAVAGDGRAEQSLQLAETVTRMAGEEYPDAPLFAGAGRPAVDVSAWKNSYREASQSLAMAIRLGEARPLYFADLSVYRLLFQLEGDPELEAFCREVLGPLLDYQGGGDLLQTLEAYCDRLGNLSQTAEKLFIHRNSLTYRLERLADLTGLDLNNPDTRLAAHLALKIRKMLQAPRRV